MKDHYNDFISYMSTEGIQWVYYFKKPKTNKVSTDGVLSTDNMSSNPVTSSINPSLNNLTELFPDLGPIFLVHDIKKVYEDPKNLLKLNEISLRSFLKSCFIVYPTDTVSVQIYNQKYELVVNIPNKKIKDIKLFSEELNQLQKFNCIYVKLQLHINDSNHERLFHEEKSLINDTNIFLQELLSKDSLTIVLDNLRLKDSNLYNTRLTLFENDLNKFYTCESFLHYSNVELYVRFLQFLSLSKYSNDYLKELDKNFKFDLNISQKLLYRLKYKYIYQGEDV